MRHNLNILVHIHELVAAVENRAQIFLPTLLWFEMAGFVKEDLHEMLSDPKDQKPLKFFQDNDRAMKEAYMKEGFAKALVSTPLPVYTDTRFVIDRDRIELFSSTKEESVATTASWLHMLTLR